MPMNRPYPGESREDFKKRMNSPKEKAKMKRMKKGKKGKKANPFARAMKGP